MIRIIRAEQLKVRHTFAKALPVAAPVVTLLLVLVLTGGMENAFPAGAWNWWYTFLLPGMLSVLCYLNISGERKSGYFSLRALPIDGRRLLVGKIAFLSGELLLANLIIFAGASMGGALLGTTIPISGGVAAAVLLSVSYLWEIPLYLFLSARFGMLASVLSFMVLSIGGVVTVADKSLWWLCPSSVPVRLMCPTLGLLPNGLPVPAGSELLNANVIFPGTLISLLWLAGMTFLVTAWFVRWEAK
ncbi:MAG: lantibiotic immunity ABC transporter MutE/EpiE family permease subunit [Eubacteriales bacterium]|nr:lantibiotic immunity ABC transporter MutE/EpiE family permease subunit [Eubacteriales bacterium]